MRRTSLSGVIEAIARSLSSDHDASSRFASLGGRQRKPKPSTPTAKPEATKAATMGAPTPGGVTHLIEGHPMASEPTNQGAKPKPTPLTTHPWALWNRSLAVTAAIVFCISTAFPVVAG